MKHLVRIAKAFITAMIDLRCTFASATSVAHAAGEVILGDVILMDTAGLNLGDASTPVFLVIACDTTLDSSGGAATVAFTLYSHSTATVTSGTPHISTAAFTETQCVAGTLLACVALPSAEYAKYVGLSYTIAGETSTAGKVNAYLSTDRPNGWKAYPANTGN